MQNKSHKHDPMLPPGGDHHLSIVSSVLTVYWAATVQAILCVENATGPGSIAGRKKADAP